MAALGSQTISAPCGVAAIREKASCAWRIIAACNLMRKQTSNINAASIARLSAEENGLA